MPCAAQGAPVPEQHVLEVRRAGLRGADVQQDPLAHASSSLGRRRRPGQHQPQRQVAGSRCPTAPRPSRGRPAAGASGRRAQRSQRRGAAVARSARACSRDPVEVLGSGTPSGRPGCVREPRPQHRRSSARALAPGDVAGPARPRSGGPGRAPRPRARRAAPRGRRTPSRAGSAAGSRTTCTRSGPTRRAQCRATGGEVDAAGQPVAARPSAGSRPATTARPGRSSGRSRRRPASGPGRCRARRPARRDRPGRPAARGQLGADRVDQLGVADQPVAGAPGPGPRRAAAAAARRPRRRPRRARAVATRSSSPADTSAGSTGRGPNGVSPRRRRPARGPAGRGRRRWRPAPGRRAPARPGRPG